MKLVDIADTAVPTILVAQAVGRWGNFFNGEAFGREVSLSFLQNLHLPTFIINGMYIDGTYREPTFLYESLSSFICFIVLLIVRRLKNIKRKHKEKRAHPDRASPPVQRFWTSRCLRRSRA